MIDMHSHILPQIDDGPVNIDESIKMLKEAYKAGFTDIVSTSHYIENEYCTTKGERKKLIQILEERLKLENIKINIYNGAEAYINTNLSDLISEGTLPTINGTKYLLVELPMNNKIICLNEIINELKNNDIIPIIAHPERYSYVQRDSNILDELIKQGVIFQANYGSIIGKYGNEAKKTVKKLLKNNVIQLLGTDTHRSGSMYTQMEKSIKKITKLVGKDKFEILSDINPLNVIENKEIIR